MLQGKKRARAILAAVERSFAAAMRDAALNSPDLSQARASFEKSIEELRQRSPVCASLWVSERATTVRMIAAELADPETPRKWPSACRQTLPEARPPLEIGDDEWSAWNDAGCPVPSVGRLWRTWAGLLIPSGMDGRPAMEVHTPWSLRSHTFSGVEHTEWVWGAFGMASGWCLAQREDDGNCVLVLDKYALEVRPLDATEVESFLLDAIRSRARSVEALL